MAYSKNFSEFFSVYYTGAQVSFLTYHNLTHVILGFYAKTYEASFIYNNFIIMLFRLWLTYTCLLYTSRCV